MKTLISLFSTPLPRARTHSAVIPPVPRPMRRGRAVGIGYGSSSGYVSAAPYAPARTPAYFRFS